MTQESLDDIIRVERFISEWPAENGAEYVNFAPGEHDDAQRVARNVTVRDIHRLVKYCDLSEGPDSLAKKLWQYVRCRQLKHDVEVFYNKHKAAIEEDVPYYMNFKDAASELLQPEHPDADFDDFTCDELILYDGNDLATWEYGASVFFLINMLDAFQLSLDMA